MLKSIETLRLRNEAREQSLAQIELSLEAMPLKPAIMGLCEMLQIPTPEDETVGAGDSQFSSMVIVANEL